MLELWIERCNFEIYKQIEHLVIQNKGDRTNISRPKP